MADKSLSIVVRIEKRAMAMRPVIAAVHEALHPLDLRLDVAEVEPLYREKIEMTHRIRSVVDGVMVTAKREAKAVLWVHIALSRPVFVSSQFSSREVDVAIIAAAGHFSPFTLAVRAEPSVKVAKPIIDGLRSMEDRARKDMPRLESSLHSPASAPLSGAVIEILLNAIFEVSGPSLDKTSDDVLQ